MVASHTWDECRPAILALEAASAEGQDANRAVTEMWATLTDAERLAFHQLCCLNIHGPQQLAVMAKIQADLKIRLA